MGDWLTDKDVSCCLNQELYHMVMDEPRASTLVIAYIKRVSKWMQMVEYGSTLDTLDVGHGLVKTLLLGLIFFLVLMTPSDTMLYGPSPN